MTREEQIKQYCAEQGFPYGACSSLSSVKATIATEAIKWADEHPKPHNPATHLGRERIGQMRKLWSTAYEHLVETMIEENHSAREIAKIFFELGFRAADEHPFVT